MAIMIVCFSAAFLILALLAVYLRMDKAPFILYGDYKSYNQLKKNIKNYDDAVKLTKDTFYSNLSTYENTSYAKMVEALRGGRISATEFEEFKTAYSAVLSGLSMTPDHVMRETEKRRDEDVSKYNKICRRAMFLETNGAIADKMIADRDTVYARVMPCEEEISQNV